MQQTHAPNRHSPATSVPRRLSSVVPFTRPDRSSRDEGNGPAGKQQFGSPSLSQGRRSSLSERGTTPPLGLSGPPATTRTSGFSLPEPLPVHQQRGFETAECSATAPLRRAEVPALQGALSRQLSREAFPANNSSALKVRGRGPSVSRQAFPLSDAVTFDGAGEVDIARLLRLVRDQRSA
jgi:hypothetical protein